MLQKLRKFRIKAQLILHLKPYLERNLETKTYTLWIITLIRREICHKLKLTCANNKPYMLSSPER